MPPTWRSSLLRIAIPARRASGFPGLIPQGSKCMPTIYEFFAPAKEDISRALQQVGRNVELSPVKELKSLHAGLVAKAVEEEMANLLDISLVGVMLRAWKKYELVRKYLGKGAANR